MKMIIAILLVILIFSRNVFAVTTTICNFPSTISTDPFTINITISGASAGTNYLRIDLYKVSTTNYFGETFNGSTWYNGGDYIQYYPVTIKSGTDWTGQIQGRLGNPTLTQYDGPGQYKMRVRRYTSSGSYTTTEAVDTIINVPISTPTPAITPTDTVTPTPTETPALTITPTVMITPIPTETPICTGQACLTPTITPTPQSYDNIYLNEALVNPAAGEKEWVEIYNDNDFSVSLINWYLDDLENAGSSPKIFSLDILPKGYAVFELSSAMFNNTGDSVRLLDFNKNLKDSFEYSSSTQGKTYGRTSLESDDFCLQEPSKNSSNNPCINPTPTIITLVKTDQINLSPTVKITSNKIPETKQNNYDVLIHRSINYPTGAVVKNYDNGNVLGISSTISNSNSLLIRCLTFVSFSYSLLTIISILFKIKLIYGKTEKFYSSFLHSS
jgi:hypothetical protein